MNFITNTCYHIYCIEILLLKCVQYDNMTNNICVCSYIDYSTKVGWKLHVVSNARTKKIWLAILCIELGIDSKILKFFTLPIALST